MVIRHEKILFPSASSSQPTDFSVLILTEIREGGTLFRILFTWLFRDVAKIPPTILANYQKVKRSTIKIVEISQGVYYLGKPSTSPLNPNAGLLPSLLYWRKWHFPDGQRRSAMKTTLTFIKLFQKHLKCVIQEKSIRNFLRFYGHCRWQVQEQQHSSTEIHFYCVKSPLDSLYFLLLLIFIRSFCRASGLN